MARHDDAAHPRHFVDQRLRVEPHVGEIEARQDVVVDAEHQHVTVVGLDLGGAQHHHAEFVFERAVVGVAIELAMLGQNDAVERALRRRSLIQLRYASTGARLSSDASLWVCRSRIVLTRIVPHLAGRNFASVTSGVTSSYTTSTGIPILTCSGGSPQGW